MKKDAGNRRLHRINSLLKEVISDVIRKEVKNPHLQGLVTVTSVETTKDLREAKVYVTVLNMDPLEALAILQQSAGFIAVSASRQIEIRYFPQLTFYLDTSLDKQMHIQTLLEKIQKESKSRE